MASRFTRRGVLAAIGCTAAAGTVFGVGAAGQEESDGDGTADPARDDYWLVTSETAATTVSDDVDEVDSDGDAVIDRGVAVDGDVRTDGHLVVGEGASVAGDVDAEGAVVTEGEVEIAGELSAGDDVLLGVDVPAGRRAYRDDALARLSDLPVVGGVVVGRDVTAAGDVVVGPASDVGGGIIAERAEETTAEGERSGPPRVVLGRRVTVAGDLRAAGDAFVGSGSTVDGAVTAGGTARFGDDVTTGSITADRIEYGDGADVFAAPDSAASDAE